MFSKGYKSEEPLEDISDISQLDIVTYYFNIKALPCLIHSPLRRDNNPSFALYCLKNDEVNYKDFSTGESGTIITLLTKLWYCSKKEAVNRIYNDLHSGNEVNQTTLNKSNKRRCKIKEKLYLQCKIREWKDYDIQYWEAYGITLKWLKYADVYPISHKIVVKDNISYAFKADKFAYAYVEFKEGHTTLKIYQPFNKNGFKWSNNHDSSVISLWTKIPKYGDKVCICSSLKDALCLWVNVGIPSIAIQGEGYRISDTAIKELKRRYKEIFICLDNDKPGLKDAQKLAEKTGFKNIILPFFEEGKDISDLRKSKGKEEFLKAIKPLFNV